MSQSGFYKFRTAVVLGYSLRVVYGLYVAIKRGHFKGATSSVSTLLGKLRVVLLSMEHYRFANAFFSVALTHHFLQKSYDRYREQNTSYAMLSEQQQKQRKTAMDVVAAIVSSAWFVKLPVPFRRLLVLHLFVRSSYDLCKLHKSDASYQLRCVPKIAHDDIWILSMILAVIAYAMCHHPSLIDQSYYKFLLKYGNDSPQTLQHMFQTPGTFVPCSPTWHAEPSCLKHYAKMFATDAVKASRMYAFVHLVPLLLQARFYKLMYGFGASFLPSPTKVSPLSKRNADADAVDTEEKEDMDMHQKSQSPRMELLRFVCKKCLAILRSAMFFAGFQHFGKLLMCWMRYYVWKRDPIYSTFACVMVGTSLAQLFETSHRRVQYSLYLLPQILTMASNALHEKYGRVPIAKLYQWWDVMLIQMSFGIYAYLKSINKANDVCSKLSIFFIINTFL